MKTYIVQRAVEAIVEQEVGAERFSGEPVGQSVVTFAPARTADAKLWEDYSTINVEARIQRRTIVTRATFDVPDDDLPQFFRAIDPDSGAVIPVRVERPPAPAAKRRVG